MIEEPVEPRFEGTTLVIETTTGPETYDSQFLVAALLVFVAKGSGSISERETEKMLQLVEEHFHLHSAESLALLNRAMTDLAENPDLTSLLKELSHVLSPEEKEDIAVMLLKVVAADGRRDVGEMEMMNVAAEIIEIEPEVRHRAFERYFAEQSP
ncbi:MAG: TerB family tellurite resistance protein [Woeseia sp.]